MRTPTKYDSANRLQALSHGFLNEVDTSPCMAVKFLAKRLGIYALLSKPQRADLGIFERQRTRLDFTLITVINSDIGIQAV